MSFFIPNAMAATPASPAVAHVPPINMILMLVVFVALIYFFMWRPQSKRVKQQREMISALKQGDEIVTSGGIIGKVLRVEEAFVMVSIAENVEIRIQKPAVASILPKGTIK